MVLLLVMWACAASGTSKWGPDLTLELPPHLLQEALFGPIKPVNGKEIIGKDPIPSAPSEWPTAPLLSNEEPVGLSSPPLKSFNPSIMLHMDTAVRVLPPRFVPQQKMKPVLYRFQTEEPA